MSDRTESSLEVSGGARSFGEQALHYFRRPHKGVAREPIESPAAWRGEDLAMSEDWTVELDEGQIEELEAAAVGALRREVKLEALSREDFPLPSLVSSIRDWTRELDGGRGFLVLRGLPVERWGEKLSAVVYWGIGLHIGVPGAQNPDGDVLGHVVDTGEDAADPFVRRYRTSGDIAFHCDLVDVVALLCLSAPRCGGACSCPRCGSEG